MSDELAAIEEAVDIPRALAVARPDAFRPDLARSLGSRSQLLRAQLPPPAATQLRPMLEQALAGAKASAENREI